MCTCSTDAALQQVNEAEERWASGIIMMTLGVLLILAFIYGAITGQSGLAIWVAFMAWIPAVLIVGPVADKIKAARA